jgi:hypothetical protein
MYNMAALTLSGIYVDDGMSPNCYLCAFPSAELRINFSKPTRTYKPIGLKFFLHTTESSGSKLAGTFRRFFRKSTELSGKFAAGTFRRMTEQIVRPSTLHAPQNAHQCCGSHMNAYGGRSAFESQNARDASGSCNR